MEGNEKIGTLEEESLKRKERLKNLKRKAPHDDNENSDHGKTRGSVLPKPKFRSYKPTDDALKELVVDEAKPGNVTDHVKSQLDAADKKEVIETLDVSNLAPRKPDWDLKRDAAKKLERLERRTQRAIAELIRDRLKSDESSDLAAAVAIGAELEATGDEE